MAGTDVLVVSVASTTGWRQSAEELAGSLARGGARVVLVHAPPLPRARTFALTDFLEASVARRACLRAIAVHDPAAIVYCSITAALLWPRPGAIWLDALAQENRPGRHGVWQRRVERRRLAQATLVLAMSERAIGEQAIGAVTSAPVLVPSPIDAADEAEPQERDIAALAYAGNPAKKRIDFVLESWGRARRADETLVVAGIERLDVPAGVELAGRLPPDRYRALLRRARVFVAAPTREDYGIAPLEALAAGCVLVTTPAPGGYPALDLARRLDPRLVADDLDRTLRIALDDPRSEYARRAHELVRPFTRPAVDRTVARDVLPRLLGGL